MAQDALTKHFDTAVHRQELIDKVNSLLKDYRTSQPIIFATNAHTTATCIAQVYVTMD